MTYFTFNPFVSRSYRYCLRKNVALCALAVSLTVLAPLPVVAQEDAQSAEEYLLNITEDNPAENANIDSDSVDMDSLNDAIKNAEQPDEVSTSDLVPLIEGSEESQIIVDPDNAPESLLNANEDFAETPDVELPTIVDDNASMPDVEGVAQTTGAQNLADEISVDADTDTDTGSVADDLPMPVANQNVLVPSEKILVTPVNPLPNPVAVQARGPRNNQANVTQVVPNDGLFFDSTGSGVQGEIAKKKAIRKVNPGNEAASKLIIVKKNASGGSQRSKLVAADRALALGRYDAAYALYTKLYDENPRDQAVLLGRAIALQKTGRHDAAVHAYQELIDLNPDVLEAQINMLGLIGKRYPAVASQRLKDLYDKNSGNAGILAQLAINEANMGRYNDALQYLVTASGYEPHNANHIYNMAIVADLSGDVNAAVQYYEQALQTDAIHGGGRSIPRESVLSRLAQLR